MSARDGTNRIFGQQRTQHSVLGSGKFLNDKGRSSPLCGSPDVGLRGLSATLPVGVLPLPSEGYSRSIGENIYFQGALKRTASMRFAPPRGAILQDLPRSPHPTGWIEIGIAIGILIPISGMTHPYRPS